MYNLEQLLSYINDAIWAVDMATGKFLYINKPLAELCDKNYEEMKTRPEIWMETIHPDDRDYAKTELAKVDVDLKVQIEHRIKTSTGIKWVSIKQVVLCGDQNNSKIIVGIVTDITDKKQFESRIIESEKTYRYLFLNNPNALWIYDRDTLKYLAVNDAAIEQYGYSREEFLNMSITDIRPKEDIPRLLRAVKGISNRYSTSSIYWRHLKKDGTLVWASITGHGVKYEGKNAEMVMAIDVTNELQIKEEILRSKKNLNTLINNTPDLIWSIDAKYNIISSNNAFQNNHKKTFGKPLNSGESILANVSEEIKKYWKNHYDRSLKGETYSITENTNNENDLILEISFHPIFDDGSRIIGVGCFAKDITERIKIDQQILNQNSRLMEIASLASHEIRGPVTSILGLINLYNHGRLDDPFNSDLMEYIKQTALQLDAVIHKIVDKTYKVEDKNPKNSVLHNQSKNVLF